MKLKLFLITLALASCAGQKVQHATERTPSSETTSAMFSPWEGPQAFAKQFKAIADAKREVKITVYSWSDNDFDKAIEAAVMNGVKVRVVVHPPLASDPKTLARMTRLENLDSTGKVDFKIAPRNMHEKFILVDGEFVVNSSANMSNGAKTKYSENFVFMDGPAHILKSFENEFAVLWNSSSDVISSDKDRTEERLPYDNSAHHVPGRDIVLYSSSMNYDYVENYDEVFNGTYVKLSAKGGGKGPYTVRDALISAIDKAKSTVHCSLNHFNMNLVSKALVEAAKRGIEVKMNVDNQEYLDQWNPHGIEQTPYFVENWKKIPGNEEKTAPVHVKFYSHAPNPALWLLNHHKYCMIDTGSSDAVLFSGSYNISETAEHNQFDNLVSYLGTKYSAIHQAYENEFDRLWNLERINDQPNKEIISFFTTVKNNSLPVHNSKAVSMTFEEISSLRKEIKAMAPNFLNKLNRDMSSCKGFDLGKKEIFGCDSH